MTDSKIQIAGQEPFPAIEFDFATNQFSVQGTCYPENTRDFFAPITGRFEEHLKSLSDTEVSFELKLSYFNSSATRVFFQMFETLEECAVAGNKVTVTWLYEEGDENMEELAEEFEDEFEVATYITKEIEV